MSIEHIQDRGHPSSLHVSHAIIWYSLSITPSRCLLTAIGLVVTTEDIIVWSAVEPGRLLRDEPCRVISMQTGSLSCFIVLSQLDLKGIKV